MTKLEEIINAKEYQVDFYLQHVNTKDFIDDVKELMAAYSDNRVIDKAIELLASCKTNVSD